MQLSRLIENLDVLSVSGPVDREVAGLAYDSRRVAKDFLFAALPGGVTDGHRFIEQAIGAGASAVLCQEAHQSPRATCIRVANSRAALADVAAAFHGNPSCHLRLVGVTGTNGKTTTTFLLRHICEAALLRCALIGTVRYEIGERILPAARTTPEALDLQDLLSQARSAGCRAVVMEASSHALAQDRVRGLEFDVCVFTNLTQDHLDYHGSMDDYYEAKKRLFDHAAHQHRKSARAVVNIDDKFGSRLSAKLAGQLPVTTYGVGAGCAFRAMNFKPEFARTSFELDAGGRKFLVRMPLIGRFNISNALAALAAAHALGIDLRTAVHALADAPQVPGRLEALPGKRSFRVYVDYAHTPDALESVLRTLRELSPRRVITVFGCGGDRDRTKRPLMARAVEAHSDHAIVTSDNPRTESPQAIIDNVVGGFRGNAFEVVPDRKEAIFRAIGLAGERDVVLIAGKGHETCQEIDGRYFPFSDVDVAGWALNDKAATH